MEINRIQEAFSAIYSEDVQVAKEVKNAAHAFLNSIIEQPQIFTQAWELFLGLSRKLITDDKTTPPISRIHEIRFWCIQTVQKNIPSQTDEGVLSIASSLWKDYISCILPKLGIAGSVPAASSSSLEQHQSQGGNYRTGEVDWVLNKALSLYVSIIGRDYPHKWPNAISVFIEKISMLHGSRDPDALNELILTITVLLFVLNLIDRDIIADEISTQTEQERLIATRIKDGLRIRDIGLCVSLCSKVFDLSLFRFETTTKSTVLVDNSSNGIQIRLLIELALKFLTHITDWADVSLILSPEFNILNTYRSAMTLYYGERCAEMALNAHSALLAKKMDPVQKALLLREGKLIKILLEAVEFQERVQIGDPIGAAEVKTASVQAYYGEALSQAVHETLDLIDLLTAQFKKLDYQGAENIKSLSLDLWQEVKGLASACLKIFTNPLRLQNVECVAQTLFQIFRRVRHLPNQAPLTPPIEDFHGIVLVCLNACIQRIKFEKSNDWNIIDQCEDDYLESVQEDGSEFSSFLVARRQSLEVFWVAFSCAESIHQTASDFLEYLESVMAAQLSASQQIDWTAVEVCVTLYTKSLESLAMDGCKSQPLPKFMLRTLRCFKEWLRLVDQPTCPVFVRTVFVIAIGKLSSFYHIKATQVDSAHTHQLLELLNFIVGANGLTSGSNIGGSQRLTRTCVKELVRVTKNVATTSVKGKDSSTSSKENLELEIARVFTPMLKVLMESNLLRLSPIPESAFYNGVPGQKEDMWLKPELRDLLVDDQEGYYQHFLKLESPEQANTCYGDQMNLFSFVSWAPLPMEEKELYISHLLKRLVDEYRTKSVGLSIYPLREFACRFLKCVSHLLKSLSSQNKTAAHSTLSEIGSLTLIIGRTLGDEEKMLETVLLVWRRLEALIPMTDLKRSTYEIVIIAHEKLLEVVRAGASVAKVESIYRQILNYLSHLQMQYKEEVVDAIFVKSHQGQLLMLWSYECLEKIGRRLSTRQDEIKNNNSLEIFFKTFENFWTKAPLSMAALTMVHSLNQHLILAGAHPIAFLLEGIQIHSHIHTALLVQTYTSVLADFIFSTESFQRSVLLKLEGLAESEPALQVRPVGQTATVDQVSSERLFCEATDAVALRLPGVLQSSMAKLSYIAAEERAASPLSDALTVLVKFAESGHLLKGRQDIMMATEGRSHLIEKALSGLLQRLMETLCFSQQSTIATQELIAELRTCNKNLKDCKRCVLKWLSNVSI